MWHVIAATSNSTGTVATGATAAAGIVGWAVVRGLWRQTRVTLPDGRRVTRAEQIAWQKQQYRQNRAASKAWEAEQRRLRGR
jgi:hypothetical protein